MTSGEATYSSSSSSSSEGSSWKSSSSSASCFLLRVDMSERIGRGESDGKGRVRDGEERKGKGKRWKGRVGSQPASFLGRAGDGASWADCSPLVLPLHANFTSEADGWLSRLLIRDVIAREERTKLFFDMIILYPGTPYSIMSRIFFFKAEGLKECLVSASAETH